MSQQDAPASPDGGVQAATATPSPTTADAAGQDRIDLKEIVGLRKEAREASRRYDELAKVLGPVQKFMAKFSAEPAADAAPAASKATGEQPIDQLRAEIAALKREAATERALSELGVTDSKQRRLAALAVKAENPEDVASFLRDLLGQQPAAPVTPAPAQQPAPQAPGRSDRGAPANPLLASVPASLNEIKPEVWAVMSDADKVAAYEAWKRKAGIQSTGNPLRDARKRREKALNLKR